MWFRKQKPDAAAASSALREAALSMSAADLGMMAGPGAPRVVALLMETGYRNAVATLACFADGTTSLYFSSGGGVIGAGEREPVRRAALALLATAESYLGALVPTTDHPVPPMGHTRFYARTFDDLRTAEALEADLGNGRLPLSPLFYSGHAVITAIRELGLFGDDRTRTEHR